MRDRRRGWTRNIVGHLFSCRTHWWSSISFGVGSDLGNGSISIAVDLWHLGGWKSASRFMMSSFSLMNSYLFFLLFAYRGSFFNFSAILRNIYRMCYLVLFNNACNYEYCTNFSLYFIVLIRDFISLFISKLSIFIISLIN